MRVALGLHALEPLLEARVGIDLSLALSEHICGNHGGCVAILQGSCGAREELEVSNCGLVCAGDEGLAVGGETLLQSGGSLLPVDLLDPLAGVLVRAWLSEHEGEQV